MTTLSCQSKFDKKIWLTHDTMKEIENPRMKMTDDLLKNHLKKGMTKAEVIKLLGKPFSEGVHYRLPEDIKIPDSVSIIQNLDKSGEEKKKVIDLYNNWHQKHILPVNLITYQIGWSYVDPTFLVIKLDDHDKAIDFWVESN